MSLKEDMDTLERHIKNGTGKEYLEGTAEPLPEKPWPLDVSRNRKPGTPAWDRERGE